MSSGLANNDKRPLMICGAWGGEFGWELFCWQAQLRAKKEREQIGEMVSITRPGHDLLYKDFSRVEHFTPTGRSNEFRNEGQDPHLLPPSDFPPRDLSGAPGKFIKFGSRTPGKGFDLLIHARNRRLRSEDNWNPENWTAVLWDLAGMSAASVGTFAESIHVLGTTDLRGLDLADLADVMASSKVIVGTSSGAMHFATLCGLPQVVWSASARTIARYVEKWNPFAVPVAAIPERSPLPEAVIERIING